MQTNYNYQFHFYVIWEPLKTGLKRENGQGVPDSRKADEVKLYALRGGLDRKSTRLNSSHYQQSRMPSSA